MLSVFVAPAFVRQRDDRQKARELKVALAEDIIAKATPVVYTATKPPVGYKPAADFEAMLEQWIEESAVLEARLRAYFPNDIAAEWDYLDEGLIRSLLEYAKALPEAQKRHAGQRWQQLWKIYTPAFAGNAENIDTRDWYLGIYLSNIGGQDKVRTEGWPQLLAEIVANDPKHSFLQGIGAEATLRLDIQRTAETRLADFTEHLLSAHMNGFSTTRGDLLRDLLP